VRPAPIATPNQCTFLLIDGPGQKAIRAALGAALIASSGAGDRSRTYDLRITNALLYQLSYTGKNLNLFTSCSCCIADGNGRTRILRTPPGQCNHPPPTRQGKTRHRRRDNTPPKTTQPDKNCQSKVQIPALRQEQTATHCTKSPVLQAFSVTRLSWHTICIRFDITSRTFVERLVLACYKQKNSEERLHEDDAKGFYPY